MPNNISLLFRCLACAALLSPLASFAGVNKCTDAAGVVTYSDQPCLAKEGLKTAEVKNSQAFAAIAAHDENKNVAQACRALVERRSRCRVAIDNMLNTAFNANCDGPMRREATDQMKDRINASRDRYNRTRNRDDSSSDKGDTNLQCEALQANMWKFVKEKFSPALKPEDIKAIDYRLAAVNPDKRDNYTGKIRHTGD